MVARNMPGGLRRSPRRVPPQSMNCRGGERRNRQRRRSAWHWCTWDRSGFATGHNTSSREQGPRLKRYGVVPFPLRPNCVAVVPLRELSSCVESKTQRKKPTWWNTHRYSTTSAYSLTSPPVGPGCSSSSLPTTSIATIYRSRLEVHLGSADDLIVWFGTGKANGSAFNTLAKVDRAARQSACVLHP